MSETEFLRKHRWRLRIEGVDDDIPLYARSFKVIEGEEKFDGVLEVEFYGSFQVLDMIKDLGFNVERKITLELNDGSFPPETRKLVFTGCLSDDGVRSIELDYRETDIVCLTTKFEFTTYRMI